MRHLIALALSVVVVAPAAAQTEVIIRRPGEKDQVIRLDTTNTLQYRVKLDSMLHRQTVLLQDHAKVLLQDHAKQLQRELGSVRINLDSVNTKTLALRSGEMSGAIKEQMAQLERTMVNLRRQPHLGIVIETAPRESDRYGAYVSAVTPGSPAEKAGIMTGDIITRIAGKSVVDRTARSDDSNDSPGLRLISLISGLQAGKAVEVELRRGTQNRTVKVTPVEDEGEMAIARMAPMPDMTPMAPTPPAMAGGFGGRSSGRIALQATPRAAEGINVFGEFTPGSYWSYSFNTNGLFSNLELAPMNDKLGAYFGTSEGVLVVNTVSERQMLVRSKSLDTTYEIGRGSAPARVETYISGGGVARGNMAPAKVQADSVFVKRQQPTFGLEPGDVIVSVDGRKVTTPSQLMRIVGTYDRGEEFKLQVMRQKHAETLPVKMP